VTVPVPAIAFLLRLGNISAETRPPRAMKYGPLLSPLLDPAEDRLAFYDGASGGPRRPETYKLYKELQGSHWTVEEHKDILAEDQRQWETLPERYKRFARRPLGFFLYGDELVIRNLVANFLTCITMPEARAFYEEQAAQERTHSEAYSLQVFGVMGSAEAAALERDAKTWPEIALLIDWANVWMSPAAGIWERLLAFGAIEGVVFSSAFAALQFFREENILPGITTFNEFIARDEGMHCDFAVHLLNSYAGAAFPSQAQAYSIVGGAAEGAIALGEAALRKEPVEGGGAPEYERLPSGMTVERLSDYVRWTANVYLQQLGFPSLYRGVTKNPLPFMDKMALNRVSKTNFFEYRPTQYQGARTDTFVWGEVDESPLRLD